MGYRRYLLVVLAGIMSLCVFITPGYAQKQYLPDLRNSCWLVWGPLPAFQSQQMWTDETVFNRDYLGALGGESKARPRQGQKVSGERWEMYQADNGKLDLELIFGRQEATLAYAYLEFNSPTAQTVALRFGSDDGVRIWLNGVPVVTRLVKRSLVPDQDVVKVNIVAGTNRMLLKVLQYNGGWGWTGRFCPLNEEASPGLIQGSVDSVQFCPERSLVGNGKYLKGTLITQPARLLTEKFNITLRTEAGKVIATTVTVPGEPFRMALPDGFNGIGVVEVAGSGKWSSLQSRSLILAGDARRLTTGLLAKARAASRKKQLPKSLASVEPTLQFLCNQVEGKVNTQLNATDRNLQALETIRELTAAMEQGSWNPGSLRGIRQWAYRSVLDGSLQPYSLYLPQNYSPQKRYRLLVTLHGFSGDDYGMITGVLKDYQPDDFIVVAPMGRGDLAYASVGEQDVLDVMNVVQQTYSIDPDQVYLMGRSMGGCGTWRIGQFYADRFAAIASFAGWTSTKYLENLRNLPVLIVHGSEDPTVDVNYSQTAAAQLYKMGYRFRYAELAGVNHNAWGGWSEKVGSHQLFEFFRQYRRNPWPERVTTVVPYLRFRKHYWVEFNDFADLSQPGRVDARIVDSRRVLVAVKNVTVFTLDLRHPKLARNGEINLTINGKNTTVTAAKNPARFAWRSGAGFVEINETPAKTAIHSGGGLTDLFSGPVYIVYGTQKRNRVKILKQTAQLLADWSPTEFNPAGVKFGRFRVIADRDLTPSRLKNANLLLVGTTEENRVTAGLAGKLPVRLNRDRVQMSGKRYAKSGLILVYPNPQAPRRLLGILSLPFNDRVIRRYTQWLNQGFRSYALEDGVGTFTTPDIMILKPNDVVWAGTFDRKWR
ncbi:MAG TPA: hypothetical protein VEC37_18635 [Bacillota bacterium]|nr:hypothetical protein [Bacillota bacterium]